MEILIRTQQGGKIVVGCLTQYRRWCDVCKMQCHLMFTPARNIQPAYRVRDLDKDKL